MRRLIEVLLIIASLALAIDVARHWDINHNLVPLESVMEHIPFSGGAENDIPFIGEEIIE